MTIRKICVDAPPFSRPNGDLRRDRNWFSKLIHEVPRLDYDLIVLNCRDVPKLPFLKGVVCIIQRWTDFEDLISSSSPSNLAVTLLFLFRFSLFWLGMDKISSSSWSIQGHGSGTKRWLSTCATWSIL